MAVAAVEAELVDVDLVGERDGLRWLVSDGKCLRGGVVGKCKSHASHYGSGADGDFQREQIGPAGKNIGHDEGLCGAVGRWRVDQALSSESL